MTRAPKVLIDLGNLRSGGGLQVGASFLDELSAIADSDSRWPWLRHARINVSAEILANVTKVSPALNINESWKHPLGRWLAPAKMTEFDVAFVLFGPDYYRRRARRTVVGFADVTSLWPDLASSKSRVRAKFRRWVSRRTFRKADQIVVEAAHIRETLNLDWNLDPGRIHVVPNTVNALFDHAMTHELRSTAEVTLFYPTRPYPHKNLGLLGEAAEILKAKFGESVTFVLTLTEDEWLRIPPLTRAHSRNVGVLKVSDLPESYRRYSGTIFPSLLEAFSVTPLEAMVMGSPLIASDRPFVRDIAEDAALYFEPTSAVDLARAIHEFISDSGAVSRRTSEGLERAHSWPTARERAVAYLNLIATQFVPDTVMDEVQREQ